MGMSKNKGNVFYLAFALACNWAIENPKIQTAVPAVPEIFYLLI